MTDVTLSPGRPTPGLTAVFSEQLGLIGRSLSREAAVLGVVFVALTVMTVWEIFNSGMKPDFPVDASLILVVMAFVFPFAVWRGEHLFGLGHMTTLPVERRLHLLTRIAAGGVWLFGVVAWIMLWLAFMGLLAGSDMGVDRHLLVGKPGPMGEVTPDLIRTFRWTPETWNWVAPFGAAAIFYLLGTAAAVGIRHRLRWAIGLFAVAVVLVGFPGEVGEEIVQTVLSGPVGLDFALNGGVGHLDTRILLPGQVEAVAWTGLPDMQAWLRALAFWLALGAALVWVSVWRHRER